MRVKRDAWLHRLGGASWWGLLGMQAGLVATLGATTAESYFAPAAGLRGEALELVLREIIDDHNVISYAGLWEAHPALYEDPGDSDRLILFYSEASWAVGDRDRGFGYEEYWNREHLIGLPNYEDRQL